MAIPMTPDLKPDEVEIIILCPVGACLAQCAYAFNKEAVNADTKSKKMLKSNIIEMATKGHNEGLHTKEAVYGR